MNSVRKASQPMSAVAEWLLRRRGSDRKVLLGAAIIIPTLLVGWLIFPMTESPPQETVEVLAKTVRARVPTSYRWLQRRAARGKWVPKALLAHVRSVDSHLGSRGALAAHRLGAMGPKAWPVIPELVDALDENQEIAWRALSALLAMKADEHPDWSRIVQRLDGKSRPVPVLLCVLPSREHVFDHHQEGDAPFAHRRLVVSALAATGKAGVAAVPELLRVVRAKRDSQLWPSAMAALVSIGADPRPCVGWLSGVLRDNEERGEIRAFAADGLAMVVPEPAGVRKLLQQMLGDPNSHVRLASARALWKWKASAEEVLPTLKGLLGHKLVSIRKGTLALLAEMGAAALPLRLQIERLAQADADETVRAAANAALKAPGLGIPRPGNGK
jgi:hypothetical protein